MRNWFKKLKKWQVVVILGLFAVIVIFCAKTIHEYRGLHKEGLSIRKMTKSHSSDIRPWMTFEYVNTVFNIPSSFLEKSLAIDDTRYPKLVISNFAKDRKVSEKEVISQIRNAVREYKRSGK